MIYRTRRRATSQARALHSQTYGGSVPLRPDYAGHGRVAAHGNARNQTDEEVHRGSARRAIYAVALWRV